MRKRKTLKKAEAKKPVMKRRIAPKRMTLNEYQMIAYVVAKGYGAGKGSTPDEEVKRGAASGTADMIVSALSEATTNLEARNVIKSFKAALPQEYDWRIMEGRRIACEAMLGLFPQQ